MLYHDSPLFDRSTPAVGLTDRSILLLRLQELGFVWEGARAREARDRMAALPGTPTALSIPTPLPAKQRRGGG
jgi:hypothetical protein